MTPSEHAKQIVRNIREQMRQAENYIRPARGVVRFCITLTDLNALLREVDLRQPFPVYQCQEWQCRFVFADGRCCTRVKDHGDDHYCDESQPVREEAIASALAQPAIEELLKGIGRDYDEPLVERVRWLVLDYEKRGELLSQATTKLRDAALAHASTAHDDEKKKKTLRVGDGAADSTRRGDSRPQPEGSER